MLVLSGADVRSALPMPRAIEAMREAFTLLAEGRADLPLRTHVPLPHKRGVFLVMPAWCDVPLGLGAKVVTVVPSNTAAGRALVHAAVVLMNAETGQVAAVVEGTRLTAIRTGATSGLATDLLARREARRLAIIGAGVQARAQLEAVCSVRPIDEIRVWSRTREHAERFVAEAASFGAPAEVTITRGAPQAAAGADIICLATAAQTPLLGPGDVPAGAHVNAIGSFEPGMMEFDPALLQGARLVVDHRAAALAEAGEVVAAVRTGVILESALTELGEVVVGKAVPRASAAEITVFKSVGLAVQDACAGARAVTRALQLGLGTAIALE